MRRIRLGSDAAGKVIRERPLPGLAHAFVFWGFCAFALITLNQFATGFGGAVSHARELAGKFYFAFAAIFGVAVAISIAGLFIRRFFVRPKWLGKVVAGIGLHRAADLRADGHLSRRALAGRATPSPGSAIWWLHTLALLIFLPLIPHTKHLHLVLSPVTVFLKREGFSRIPPLAGDEDFGLDTGKDVTRIDALQAFSCVECGRCTEHCPGDQHGQGSQPEGDRARAARLPERIRPGAAKSRCSASTSPRRRRSSAPPAALANFSVRWASSICR